MENQHEKWQKVIGRLRYNLNNDLRNGRMLMAPWSRAAHSMAKGWQIRMSRPPAKGNVKVTPRPTWKVFARLAAAILACKKNHAQKSPWYLWATRRASGGSRYIRKSKRTW